MNRSISLSLLAIAALSASAAMAQSSFADQYGKQPTNYVSPQQRINPSTTPVAPPSKVTASSLPVLGYVVQNPVPVGRPLAAGDKITGQVTGAGPLCTKKGCVPVIGRTADQKYPVYGIKGDLEDINYMTTDGKTVYQPTDLFKRMGYVETSDVKGHGIQCEFICKNAAGQVIGLNPQVKWMEAKVK